MQIFLYAVIFLTLLHGCAAVDQSTESGEMQEDRAFDRKRYSCITCVDLGRTCRGPVISDCEYCAKVTGALRDLSQLPDWASKYITDVYGNITISDYKDKLVTLKTCVSGSFVEMVGFVPERGCKPFTRYGFRGRGCLCRGECPKPKSRPATDKSFRLSTMTSAIIETPVPV